MLAAIGALAYFGVLSPERFLKQPNYNDCCKMQCETAGLGYNSYKLYSDVTRLDCDCKMPSTWNATVNMTASVLLVTEDPTPRELCQNFIERK